MIKILAKEFNAFLDSLIAYVVIGVFLVSMGLLMWVFPETSIPASGYAGLDPLFSYGPYIFIFLVPAITMRSFAEEKKSGTMELLITRPLRDIDIVMGKFLAAFLLVLFSLLPTFVYYYSVYQLSDPVGHVDSAGILGSYLGLALLGGVFCSMGLLASSMATNQIVAFLLAAFLCFFLFTGFESLSLLDIPPALALWLKQLGMRYHYEAMGKGLVDSRDVVYFFSVAWVMLGIAKLTLSSRLW